MRHVVKDTPPLFSSVSRSSIALTGDGNAVAANEKFNKFKPNNQWRSDALCGLQGVGIEELRTKNLKSGPYHSFETKWAQLECGRALACSHRILQCEAVKLKWHMTMFSILTGT